jgi:IS30 family transposase
MQRYQIEAYLKTQMKQKDIAVQLGVSTSTISRELSRNKTKIGKYSARHAHILTQERKERFYKNRTFTINEQRIVDCYLIKEQWSPEQIVGYCKRKNIPMVSIERIYQYIRKDKALGGDMYKNLRHKLKHRKRPVGGKQVAIKNRISIEERPEIINKKQRMGDWEIDTIIGKNQKGAIVTIVERVSNFFMMKKLENGRKAKALAKDVFFLLIPYKD